MEFISETKLTMFPAFIYATTGIDTAFIPDRVQKNNIGALQVSGH